MESVRNWFEQYPLNDGAEAQRRHFSNAYVSRDAFRSLLSKDI